MRDADDTDWQPRRQHRRAAAFPTTSYVAYYPGDDEACKALISWLGAYDWKLARARWGSGEHPYRLQTDINGTKHIIHLPQRKGTVLQWLEEQQAARRAE